MKEITLNEAEKVVGGAKWLIECRRPRVVTPWQITREAKSMTDKKAHKECGDYNYAAWYKEIK